jgi:hypothetical protein
MTNKNLEARPCAGAQGSSRRAIRGRLSLIRVSSGTLHTAKGIVRDSIQVAQVSEERRQRGKPSPHGRGRELALLKRLPPRDHMSAGNNPKFFWLNDPGELHEVAQLAARGSDHPRRFEIGLPTRS